MNYDKTASCIVSSKHNAKIKVRPIKTLSEHKKVKALGIRLTQDPRETQLLNYEERAEKISNVSKLRLVIYLQKFTTFTAGLYS